MVRGKTQMKRIDNAASRQVTFTKRRSGLLKKAYELSVLCDAEVGLVIFSPSGKLYEFASPSMQKMWEKYQKCTQENSTNHTTREQVNERLSRGIANMEERIRILESRERKIMGEGIATCSMKELDELEMQVERGLRHIRARKTEVLMGQIEQLKRKERVLSEENDFLLKKVSTIDAIGFGSVSHIEVETQLVISPPGYSIRSPSCE